MGNVGAVNLLRRQVLYPVELRSLIVYLQGLRRASLALHFSLTDTVVPVKHFFWKK